MPAYFSKFPKIYYDAVGKGNYKLVEQLEEAYKASLPNQFQKDFIELDRRINLLYSAIEGKIMRVFPIPNDKNNKWVSYQEIKENDFKGKDSLYVKNILPLYFQFFQLQHIIQV